MLLLGVGAGVFLSGCEIFNKRTSEEEILIKDTVPPETKRKLEEALVEIPQPTEIFRLMHAETFSFSEGITLPHNAHTRATTTDEKTLVAGAYSADLSYMAVMSRRPLAEKYISSLYEIAQELGLGSVFDEEFMENARNSIDSPKALNELITRAFVRVDKYLRSNERVRQAAVLLAGSWTEGIWLALNMLKNKQLNEKTTPLFGKIGEQTYTLPKVIALLEQYGNDPSVQKIISALRPAQEWYAKNIEISQDFKPEHVEQLLPLIGNARQSLFGSAL